MRKNMKKISCAVTVAILAAAVFAGCGGGTVSEEETLARSTTTAAAEENTAAGSDDSPEAGQSDAEGTTKQENGDPEGTAVTDEEDTESAEVEAAEAETQETELTCALLFEEAAQQAADGAGQLTERETCTFVSKSYRDSLDDFFYASDSEQVYCVCIVKADSEATAVAVLQEFNDTLESAQNDMYLTTDEQKVVKAAVTGSSGCYVWYLSLSEDSEVEKAAETAVMTCLENAR